MRTTYQLTPRALDDLDEITSYIAVDSKAASDRVESAIFDACKMLARNPFLGSRRKEVTALPVCFWVVTRFPSYVIVFRPETAPLQVVAVLHAKRDIRRVLAEREAR